MMTSFGLAFLLAAVAATTGAPTPVVDEARLQREIDRLSDETPPCDVATTTRYLVIIREGIEAHDKHDYARAVELYRRAIALCPLEAPARYELGFSLSATGEMSQALETIVQARLLNPKVEQFYVMEGNILDDLGFPEEAEAVYRRLVESLPTSYMGHLNLGIALVRRSQLDEAERELARARAADPKHPSSYFQMAQLARQRGEEYFERDQLKEFVERGDGDSRLPSVKARLAELNEFHIEIELDSETPYLPIAAAVVLMRTEWRTDKYERTFPGARGYVPSFAEEKDIASHAVLPMWRDEKQKDPNAAHPAYDRLLKVAEAGHLDAYLNHQNRDRFGEDGARWLEQHAAELTAFLAWARAENLMETPKAAAESRESDAPSTAPARDLPGIVMKALIDSPKAYVFDLVASAEDISRYHDLETARFRSLDLRGEETLDCELEAKTLDQKMGNLQAMDGLVAALRCAFPADPQWAKAVTLMARLGLTMRAFQPKPSGAVLASDDATAIKVKDTSWLSYLVAKAAWGEDAIRSAYGGPPTGASVAEELFAYGVLLAGYQNSLEPNPEAADSEAEKAEAASEPAERDPAIEAILEVAHRGHLRGFVLFEVLHKGYGVSLVSLDAGDARAVRGYLVHEALVNNRRSGD